MPSATTPSSDASSVLAPPTGVPLPSPILDEVRRGLLAALPVMLGFMPFGLVLGAQAGHKGLSLSEVPLLVGLNFGGGSEFAAIALWTSPPQLLLIVAVTFLVNSRHLLMGAVLAPYLAGLPRRKVLPALFFMCDESWALGLADARRRAALGLPGPFSLPYYLAISLSLYVTWVVSATTGALVGPLIGDLEARGLHMAFPAVFLVLLRGLWTDWQAARPWAVSLAVAAGVHLLAPGAWSVAAGALAGLVAAWIWVGQSTCGAAA